MWNRIEESSTEDETLGSSFFTNGLFKISNDEEVRDKFEGRRKKMFLNEIL